MNRSPIHLKCLLCQDEDFSASVHCLIVWQVGTPLPHTIVVEQGAVFLCNTTECMRAQISKLVEDSPVTKEYGIWYHAVVVCDNIDCCDIPNPEGWMALKPPTAQA